MTGTLEINRNAPCERIQLSEHSWCDYVPHFLCDPAEVLAAVIENTQWNQGQVWRYERYVEEKRLGALLKPESQPVALRQTELHLSAHYGVGFLAPTALWYRDGSDFQGLHRDRSLKWLSQTLVGGVVLGPPRPMVFRPARDWTDPAARADSSEDVVLMPGEGDLIMMGGRFQLEFLHGVPAVAQHDTPRVSIIWRWTSRAGRPDTAPSYFDGRSFAGDTNRRPGYLTRPTRRE